MSLSRLVLLRHARAEGQSDSGRDRDRALTEIGRGDAARQADRLAMLGVGPDRIVASPALRALETAAIVGDRLAPEQAPARVAAVYEAVAGDLIDALAKQAGAEILLVGHNPGISALGGLLSGRPIALSAGGFVVLEFKPPAAHPLQPGSGRVAHYCPRPDSEAA